jgi:PAS domain S-box-containing protein
VRVNRTLCELLGYAADELVELRSHDITHPDDRDADTGRSARTGGAAEMDAAPAHER